MLNVADSQTIELTIDGQRFSMFEGTVLESSRSLDMEKGVTVRQVIWRSPAGHEVEICIRRMTSFELLELFTIEYTVKALNFSGALAFKSVHNGDVKNYCNPNDPRVAGESFVHLKPHDLEIPGEGASVLTTDTVSSGLQVCTYVKNVCSVPASMNRIQEGHCVTWNIDCSVSQGQSVFK